MHKTLIGLITGFVLGAAGLATSSVWNYSTTAGDNASFPGGSWAENMAPSAVNDSARQNMADTAEFVKLITAQYTTAGTADTQTITPTPAWSAYANGQRILVKIGAGLTNTGTATFNVSSLGAKTIYRNDGTTTLTAGELVAGSVVEAVYDSAINGFRLLTNSGTFAALTVSGNATVGGTLGVTGVASFANGSVSAPSVAFTSDPNTGLYRIGADALGIAVGGTGVGWYSTAGFGVFAAATNGEFDLTKSEAGGRVSAHVQNSDNTNTGSHAEIYLRSGGTSGGDPLIRFEIPSGTTWSVGVDNSDSDAFKISNNASLGTSDMLVIGTDGAFSVEGRSVLDGSGDIPAARISTNLKDAVATGAILQSVSPAAYTATTALTTHLPADDTVPSSGEGDSILSQAITPVSSSNKVRVRINGFGSHASGQRLVWALFRGTTYIGGGSAVSNSSYAVPIFSEIVDSPATTSSTTYSLRVGPGGAAETVRLNYDYALGSRLFGGSAVVTMVVEEIKG